MEKAKGLMPGLPTKGHQTDWMAKPPSNLAIPRRQRWHDEFGAAPSGVSPKSSQPKSGGDDAAFIKERWKGLS